MPVPRAVDDAFEYWLSPFRCGSRLSLLRRPRSRACALERRTELRAASARAIHLVRDPFRPRPRDQEPRLHLLRGGPGDESSHHELRLYSGAWGIGSDYRELHQLEFRGRGLRLPGGGIGRQGRIFHHPCLGEHLASLRVQQGEETLLDEWAKKPREPESSVRFLRRLAPPWVCRRRAEAWPCASGPVPTGDAC